MKICILGLGYIGLPTAAMFASRGFDVVGVDVNKNVVEALNIGEIIIEEPHLGDIVKKAVADGRLKGTLKPEDADVFIISVPTPITEEKKADMKYVESAAVSILPHLKEGNTVILESTSPPKTVESLLCPILAKSGLKIGEQLYVAHSPERVLPGKILYELENNNRVIGGVNKKSAEIVKELYESFVKAEIYLTDATTAEMCKLMENTYRDVNIALANEIAKIAEKLEINAWEVIELSNKHPRVNIHSPGPGVGGHCIAVDPWFIIEKVTSLAEIINLSRETNDGMPEYVVEISENMLGGEGSLNGKKITMLGVTYKANVDDMRESPIVYIIDMLKEKGAEVVVVDPHVNEFKAAFDEIGESLKDAELMILGVNHDEFKDLDFASVKSLMKKANVLDTRNFFDGIKLRNMGINYKLLGAKQ